MKKLRVFSIAVLTVFLGHSQTEFWGMTSQGGTDNFGTIFKTDGNGNNLSVEHSFANGTPGSSPAYLQMTETSGGKLYGMTNAGGANNMGVLFEFDANTNIYTRKKDFDGANSGSFPYGSLTLASNGKLYGMTAWGGSNDMGVLFEFDPATNNFVKKLDFDGANYGSKPFGVLMQAANGKLYGMTNTGGSNNLGVLFEYNITSSAYAKLLDFDGAVYGKNPYGGLMQATNGKLYGMTYQGGTYNYGVLFEYDIASAIFSAKFDFNNSTTDGVLPYGEVMQASNGKLYGMTHGGGANYWPGVIFEFDPATNIYTKKIDFTFADGCNPYGKLTEAPNGMLYGLSSNASNHGSLIEYNIAANTCTKKIDFATDNSLGDVPEGSLTLCSNGKLYGVTSSGGITGKGILFEYNISTGILVKKTEFNSSDGQYPKGGLTAVNSKLYGMTENGGANFMGILFEFDRSTNVFTNLFNFDGAYNGSFPLGNVMHCSNGKLYGMTNSGGVNNLGTLFEFDPSGNVFTKKFDFDGAASGSSPYGNLTEAANGKLYGMTSQGGANNNNGVLFSFDPSTGIFSKLKDFDLMISGAFPYGSLTAGSNGKLYGMTSQGGGIFYSCEPMVDIYEGLIFEFDPLTNVFTKKADMDYTITGGCASGNLIEASNGKFYALSDSNNFCMNGDGKLFEYDPITNTRTGLFTFGSSNGKIPNGSLMQASNGNLYGTTTYSGINNTGVLFEFDISTGTYSKKTDFTGANGAFPVYLQLIELNATGISSTVSQQVSYTIFPNPFQEEAALKISSKEKIKNAALKIFDVTGRLQKNISGINSDEIKLKREEMSPGIYFFELINGSSVKLKGKFVIE